MTKRAWLAVTGLLLLNAAGAAAEHVAGLPVHIDRLDSRAIRVWLGDHISSTATVAIATDEGVVVLDTTGDPRMDRELRRIIARELGRDDFKYLINTHEHSDHTGGNAVYADCVIVGHARVAEGMIAQRERQAQNLEYAKSYLAELEGQLAAARADSLAAAKLSEQVTRTRLTLDARESSADLHPPTKTFTGRLDLRVGDTTFELYDIGGMHSASDIAVLVPEHGLLMTGDTMADVWLTDTPGCLASFMARPGVPHDFPRMLANWDLLLARKDAVRKLVPGHWNGELSWAGFAARVDYVRALWEGVKQGVAAGKGLAELQREYALQARFPELAASPGFSGYNNYTSILEMWSDATGQESAADRLYGLVEEGAADDAIGQIVATRDANSSPYYFLEEQINLAGYRFLREEKVEQAIRMFRINVELFPQSWNVYDSLGEGMLRSGDAAAAAAMYEKSLALNPDSPSGREALARIRGEPEGR